MHILLLSNQIAFFLCISTNELTSSRCEFDTLMSSSDFCVIQLDGWTTWWEHTKRGSVQNYVSILLFFLSAVLAYPIARSLFFLLRKFSPKKWKYVYLSVSLA